MELDATDVSFISNRAAVYFEMGKWVAPRGARPLQHATGDGGWWRPRRWLDGCRPLLNEQRVQSAQCMFWIVLEAPLLGAWGCLAGWPARWLSDAAAHRQPLAARQAAPGPAALLRRYEECVADCDTAVDKGREQRADYKLIGRALTRKARMPPHTPLAAMARAPMEHALRRPIPASGPGRPILSTVPRSSPPPTPSPTHPPAAGPLAGQRAGQAGPP
jgi:hypothetical protein